MLAMTKVRGIRWAWLALAIGFIPASAPAVTTPNQFVQSQKIVANDVNANFKALADAVTALEIARPVAKGPNGKTYSLDAAFKATTAAATTGKITAGALTGYAAAKKLCEDETKSASAHMCTTTEMVRSIAMGIAPPQGYVWVASGLAHSDQGLAVAAERNSSDCFGYAWENLAAPSVSGTAWFANSTSTHPSTGVCNSSYKIACCD